MFLMVGLTFMTRVGSFAAACPQMPRAKKTMAILVAFTVMLSQRNDDALKERFFMSFTSMFCWLGVYQRFCSDRSSLQERDKAMFLRRQELASTSGT